MLSGLTPAWLKTMFQVPPLGEVAPCTIEPVAPPKFIKSDKYSISESMCPALNTDPKPFPCHVHSRAAGKVKATGQDDL